MHLSDNYLFKYIIILWIIYLTSSMIRSLLVGGYCYIPMKLITFALRLPELLKSFLSRYFQHWKICVCYHDVQICGYWLCYRSFKVSFLNSSFTGPSYSKAGKGIVK